MERQVDTESVERCRSLASGDPSVSGNACGSVRLLRAEPESASAAYARASLTYIHDALGAAPGVEFLGGLEGIGNGTTLDLHLRAFSAPIGDSANGKTRAGRVGLGLQIRYALQDTPDGSYRGGAIPDVKPYAFIAASF